MRICFFAGADSIHSYRWVKYFADRNHDVYWISLSALGFEPIKSVKFFELKKFQTKTLTILYSAIKIRGLIKSIRPDIIHAHYIGTYGLLGALSRWKPLILTAWGSDILFAGRSKVKGPFVEHILKKADLITCDADHMIEAMVRLGVDDKKIKLVYFGIDTDKFCPGMRNIALRNKLRIFDSPMIISLRSLEPIYDVKFLIDAVPYVLKEIPEANFVIAGIGSQGEALKRLSHSLGVLDSIRFIGKVPNEGLPEYLRTADIYVSTSLSDAGISASTAEAMACELPVVVTGSGENRKWILDGENGFVIPARSPEVLAERIIFLLKNEDVRKRFGKAGRKVIEDKNNYYKEMEKMEGFYKNILSDG